MSVSRVPPILEEDTDTHQARAYAIMPFVWSIGSIIGPAIGGTLAKPAHAFPRFFPQHGFWTRYPYLLPNLVCALLLFVSIIVGWILLEETHPDMQLWSTEEDLINTRAETPLLATAAATEHPGVDLRGDSYGTFNTVDIEEHPRWLVNSDGSQRTNSQTRTSPSKKTFSKQVILLVVALGIFTFHSMTYDCLLPVFLQDDREKIHSESSESSFRINGGLGLSTQAVGGIMSINGVIALFVQGALFPIIAGWLGIWKTFIVVTVLHPIAYILVPYIVLLSDSWLYPGIYACFTVRNLLSILAYPVLLILLKEATPSRSSLGKVNGLAASAGAACRTIAPPISGYLYDLGNKLGFTGLAWWASAAVALVGALQCWSISREKNKTVHVRGVHCVYSGPEQEAAKHEEVHILVDDVDHQV
jgi:hypothetical protein